MKRRRFFQSVAALPALQVVPASAQYAGSTAASSEMPNLAETSPEAVAESVRRFFTLDQFQALQKLAGLIVPKPACMNSMLTSRAPAR